MFGIYFREKGGVNNFEIKLFSYKIGFERIGHLFLILLVPKYNICQIILVKNISILAQGLRLIVNYSSIAEPWYEEGWKRHPLKVLN